MLTDSPEYHCLSKNGYKSGHPEMQLRLDFDDFRMSAEVQQARDRLASEGIEIGYYEGKHRESLAKLMEDQFQSWWYQAYRPNLLSESPKGLLLAAEGDRVVGFVSFVHVSEDGNASFCPGVDAAFRRREQPPMCGGMPVSTSR